jgi:hypothetical protein
MLIVFSRCLSLFSFFVCPFFLFSLDILLPVRCLFLAFIKPEKALWW